MSKLENTYNSFEELQEQIEEQGGGGGGDVDKEYVDNKVNEEKTRAQGVENQLSNRITAESERATAEENTLNLNKQDKLTAGTDLSTVSDSTEASYVDLTNKNVISFTLATLWNWIETKIKTTISSASTDKDIVSGKAVYTELEKKLNKEWNYVGILSASSGSTLTVKDDWNELFIIARVKEGSDAYNIVNIIPKQGFTQGPPTGNVAMFGFFWNENYNAKARIGINGTGDSRKLQLGYTNQTGWAISGFYVYKR